MLLFYVNYDIILCDNKLFRFQLTTMEDGKMITQLDGMELVGRAFRVPKEGITFKTLNLERINIFPVETNKERVFNYSANKDFYIFAAGFGTFIIPALFGLDELLKGSNFKKVSDDILPVKLSSNHMPLYTKDQSEWYHMINAIGQLNASTAHTLLRLEGWDLGIFDFLTPSSKIPFTGIYDQKAHRMFYPMASIKFPHIDKSKVGKFNTDNKNHLLLVYAGDGDTYLIKDDTNINPMVAALKDSGYKHDKSLYVPLR